MTVCEIFRKKTYLLLYFFIPFITFFTFSIFLNIIYINKDLITGSQIEYLQIIQKFIVDFKKGVMLIFVPNIENNSLIKNFDLFLLYFKDNYFLTILYLSCLIKLF